MWTATSKYYGPDFKASVIKVIRELRAGAKVSLIGSEARRNGLVYGSRCADDEQVWQGFCQNWDALFRGCLSYHDSEAKAAELAKALLSEPKVLYAEVWEAFRNAASADFYYTYEKDWGREDQSASLSETYADQD